MTNHGSSARPRGTSWGAVSSAWVMSAVMDCPMCCWATLNSGVGTLVLGARHAQIQRTDMGDYSVEKFMVLTGRKIELVTGIRAEEGEAIRRQGTAPMPPTAEG